MSIRTKIDVVNIAAADCALRRANVIAAWRGLKQETERAATPGRVIGAGLITGFVSGLRRSPSVASVPLGDRLFNMLIDTAFASFGAAITAGVAAATAQDESVAPKSSAAHSTDTRTSSTSID